MNLEIIRSDYFTKEFKRLAKRYRSLIDDYEAFLDNLRLNPLQGDEIAPTVKYICCLYMTKPTLQMSK